MHPQNRVYEFVIVVITLGIISWFYFGGLQDVPFHPDESTQIYMSSDVDQFIANPLSLAWSPSTPADSRLRYHLIDAPLTWTVIGLARKITVSPGLPGDWNWSEDWQFNKETGALPSKDLLQLARLSVSIFFPLTLLCLYFTVKDAFSTFPAIIATLMLASNALILLHTRRAMAESLLVFTICLSLFVLVKFTKEPWLSAIPIALAINAKQSALPLVVIGFVAILVFTPIKGKSARIIVSHILRFGLIIIAIYFLLNPILWKHPVKGFQESLAARSALTQQQISTLQAVDVQKVLISFTQKIAGLIGNLYIIPPAIEDVGNYTNELHSSTQAYLAHPAHTLLRGFTGGAVVFILSLLGFLILKKHIDISTSLKKKKILLLAAATLIQLITNLTLFSLPFQRYVITLVPYTCIWCAVGISTLVATILKLLPGKNQSMQP